MSDERPTPRLTSRYFGKLNQKRIGERFKEARIRNNISQMEAVRALDIARQTYLDIEGGKALPKLQHIMAFCANFNIDLNWLIHWEAHGLTNCNECPLLTNPRLVKAVEAYTGETLGIHYEHTN